MRANCLGVSVEGFSAASTSPTFRKIKKETDFVPMQKPYKGHGAKYSKSAIFENTSLSPFDLYGPQLLVKNPEVKWEEEFKIRCLVDDQNGVLRTAYLHSPIGHTKIQVDEKGKPHEIMFQANVEDSDHSFVARAKITGLGFLSDIKVIKVKKNEGSSKTTEVSLGETKMTRELRACDIAQILESQLDVFNSIYPRGKLLLDIRRQIH